MDIQNLRNSIKILQDTFKKFILEGLQKGSGHEVARQVGGGKRQDKRIVNYEIASLEELWDEFYAVLNNVERIHVRRWKKDLQTLLNLIDTAKTSDEINDYQETQAKLLDEIQEVRIAKFGFRTVYDFILEKKQLEDKLEKLQGKILRASNPGIKTNLENAAGKTAEELGNVIAHIEKFDENADIIQEGRTERYGIREDEDDEKKFGHVRKEVNEFRRSQNPRWPDIDFDSDPKDAQAAADEILGLLKLPENALNRPSVKRYKTRVETQTAKAIIKTNAFFEKRLNKLKNRFEEDRLKREKRKNEKEKARLEKYEETYKKWRDLIKENNKNIKLEKRSKKNMMALKKNHFVLSDAAASALVDLDNISKQKKLTIKELREKVNNINDLYYLPPKKRKVDDEPGKSGVLTRAQKAAADRAAALAASNSRRRRAGRR